jgi:hypothetical protein
MSTWNLLGTSFLTAVVCFTACGGDDDGDGDGDDGGATGGRTTGGTAGEGGASNGGSSTGGTSRGGTSTGGTSTGGTSTGGGAGEAGAPSGVGGEGGEPGAGGEGGASCVPTEPADEVCDDVDNDCNGEVDDVDAGNDGIRDCLNILLIGAPGQFASTTFQSWLEEQGASSVSRIHASGTPAELTNADLGGFDVAILDSLLKEYTEAESQSLAAWVRAGGGLVSLNGHTGSTDRVRGNSLIAELGVEHIEGLRSATVTVFHSHPITTDITSIFFNGGYRLADLPDGEGSTVIAELSDGAAGVALERGEGRAFVWGDEWIEFDSQWGSYPQVRTFWVNAIGWVSKAL